MTSSVTSSLAQLPSDEELKNYDVFRGGFLEIPDQSIVEGSIEKGGMQPHYQVDFSSPDFIELRNYARGLKEEKDILNKAEKIKTYINAKVLVFKKYDDHSYLSVMREYRDRGTNIPLSRYKKNKGGVCREHAMIYHQALKDAGIENYYLYVKARHGSHVEDHAVNAVKINDEWIILDSYNNTFHNHSLEALKKGVFTTGGVAKVEEVLSFPKVYVPKKEFIVQKQECVTFFDRYLKRIFGRH